MNYRKIHDSIIEKARTRKLSGYKEKHHIIPRCMGGSDDENNLVDLTPEEHFLIHVLLVKLYPENRDLIYAVNVMGSSRHGHRPRRKLYGWLKRKFAERVSQQMREMYPKGTRFRAYNEETDTLIYVSDIDDLPEGFRKGSRPCSEEQKKNISFSLQNRYKERPHHLKGISSTSSGCFKPGEKSWNSGKKCPSLAKTAEEREHISSVMKEHWKNNVHPRKGKPPANKGKTGMQIAWNKGKEAKKFVCPHCDKTIGGESNFKRWHNENCKMR